MIQFLNLGLCLIPFPSYTSFAFSFRFMYFYIQKDVCILHRLQYKYEFVEFVFLSVYCFSLLLFDGSILQVYCPFLNLSMRISIPKQNTCTCMHVTFFLNEFDPKGRGSLDLT